LNPHFFIAKFIPFKGEITAQTYEKLRGKRKATKKSKRPGEIGRGSHHAPWWSQWPGRGAHWPEWYTASRTLHFVLCLGLHFVPWINCLGPIGPLLQALLTWFGLMFMLFS